MNEGLIVRMVSAFYRDNEPVGIATGIEFHGDDGVGFCRNLLVLLRALDARFTPAEVQQDLRLRSPRRDMLTYRESVGIIGAINWLQVRGHLVADEYNGTMFVCEFEGALINCETNPVTIDLRKARVGEAAVDVTDIVHASRDTLDGGVAAIRAAADYARGRR